MTKTKGLNLGWVVVIIIGILYALNKGIIPNLSTQQMYTQDGNPLMSCTDYPTYKECFGTNLYPDATGETHLILNYENSVGDYCTGGSDTGFSCNVQLKLTETASPFRSYCSKDWGRNNQLKLYGLFDRYNYGLSPGYSYDVQIRYWKKTTPTSNIDGCTNYIINPPVCAQDTMLCQDGSYVSRVAPDCNFATCPPVNNNQTVCPTEITIITIISIFCVD